jgi:hypothetical protein
MNFQRPPGRERRPEGEPGGAMDPNPEAADLKFVSTIHRRSDVSGLTRAQAGIFERWLLDSYAPPSTYSLPVEELRREASRLFRAGWEPWEIHATLDLSAVTK